MALAGASPRLREPAHARARSGQLVWRDRRGRSGVDRRALPRRRRESATRVGAAPGRHRQRWARF
eukprot:5908175-Pyramimonas_sp.AAC.1